MKTNVKSSFGARLRRAQDLLTYLSEFGNYQPPRPEENIENLRTLVDAMVAANYSASSTKDLYRKTVNDRQSVFKGKDESVERFLVSVRGAVEAIYGKKSAEMNILSTPIRKMRSIKLTKPPADPSDPAKESNSRRTEKSFGSMTQIFNDIIAALEQFSGYDSSNPKLRIEYLKEFSARLTAFNNEVAKQIHAVKSAIASRKLLFEEMKTRSLRIKAYVKAQYGSQSKESGMINNLRF